VSKLRNVLRGLRQVWGSPRGKQKLWNNEFSEGRWDFIENTANDIVYRFVERHSRRGSILDLGCGSGNTGCELDANSYREYIGVDISDVALEKAKLRSEKCGRSRPNRYVQSDIATYIPDGEYDVILFRESIYYMPRRQIRAALDRYSRCLKEGGVIIVRCHDRRVAQELLKVIRSGFEIVENYWSNASGPVVVILRPEVGVRNVGMPRQQT
jgi:SAM-dependent methyltransferase